MTEARYQELLGRLLDGSLAEGDAEELRRGLERDPDRLRDVREHLMFSDLLGQAQNPHRSPEDFWSGVRSRLAGDVPAGADPGTSMAPRAALSSRRRMGRWLAGGALAAGLLIALAVAARRPPERQDRPDGATEVSLRGEVVCAHCYLHQVEECRPAIRVVAGGHEEVLLLDDNDVCRDFKHKEGCGRIPVRVVAEGTVHDEGGHPQLGATRLEALH